MERKIWVCKDLFWIATHFQMYWTSSSREIAQSHKSIVNAMAVVIFTLVELTNLISAAWMRTSHPISRGEFFGQERWLIHCRDVEGQRLNFQWTELAVCAGPIVWSCKGDSRLKEKSPHQCLLFWKKAWERWSSTLTVETLLKIETLTRNTSLSPMFGFSMFGGRRELLTLNELVTSGYPVCRD